MPDYTIETTYHLPVFRSRSYSAKTLAAACRAAIEDDDWGDAKQDNDSAGETHVTGVWEGENAAYRGEAIPVPSRFSGAVHRKLGHFETLLGLLKMIVTDVLTHRSTSNEWLARASWAVARGEAILAGRDDPDHPLQSPPPGGDPTGDQPDSPDLPDSED